VEVLLAAAAEGAPPPLAELVEPELLDALPDGVPALLALLVLAEKRSVCRYAARS
jgi:hypothetical protein